MRVGRAASVALQQVDRVLRPVAVNPGGQWNQIGPVVGCGDRQFGRPSRGDHNSIVTAGTEAGCLIAGPMASGVTEPRTAGSAASGAVAYLLAARALRDFGDGFVAILLPVYLLALGFSPLEIGVIATAALLGSALLTLGIGLIGSRHDRQRLLLAGASLMTATGVAFAVVHRPTTFPCCFPLVGAWGTTGTPALAGEARSEVDRAVPADAFGGRVRLKFPPDGVVCILSTTLDGRAPRVRSGYATSRPAKHLCDRRLLRYSLRIGNAVGSKEP